MTRLTTALALLVGVTCIVIVSLTTPIVAATNTLIDHRAEQSARARPRS